MRKGASIDAMMRRSDDADKVSHQPAWRGARGILRDDGGAASRQVVDDQRSNVSCTGADFSAGADHIAA